MTTTDETHKMLIEWNHSVTDHLDITEHSILYSSNSELARDTRRKGKVLLFPMFCFPIVVFFLIRLQDQTVVSGLGIAGIFGFVFWIFVIKEPNHVAIEKGAKKLAAKYLDQKTDLPIGTYQMRITDNIIEWFWVDGNEKNSYPLSKIESIQEKNSRLYILRKNEIAESIPFHAFGDVETRLDFLKRIEESRNDVANA